LRSYRYFPALLIFKLRPGKRMRILTSNGGNRAFPQIQGELLKQAQMLVMKGSKSCLLAQPQRNQ
jgi:hypothetical protein